GLPAHTLAVVPREPVVRYGGSVQLNCSLACTGGTVQWKGLDTNMGSITSFPTHSILHISSAVVAMEGTKFCLGTCHGKTDQHSVNLKVYALPDTLQLDVEPHTPVPTQPAHLRCSAQRVYPLTGLLLTWYRGDQVLEEADFNVTETEEELFDIVSTLPVAGKEVEEGVEFRCEVTLHIGQETFTRVASLTVSTAGDVPTHGPTTALPTSSREPNAETTLELADATKPTFRERPAPQDLATSSATAPPATSTLPGSNATTPRAEGTAVDGIGWVSAPAEQGTGLATSSVPACSLRIWSLPPNGTRGRALRIECHARCTGNATVRWLRTPVALTQYQEEVTGSSSTLRLHHAEPQHQGHYECALLGHRSQVVSLQLAVSDEMPSMVPAIATGSTASLLGMIVTGIVSRQLWKRFRSRYELS
ncbi:MADCA protein, partial [Geococcyx californianus]|nr:MADCA protein [Geococcyx californianus]